MACLWGFKGHFDLVGPILSLIGPILGLFWHILSLSGPILGRFWACLTLFGLCLGIFRGVWGHFGPDLGKVGPFSEFLGQFGPVLGVLSRIWEFSIIPIFTATFLVFSGESTLSLQSFFFLFFAQLQMWTAPKMFPLRQCSIHIGASCLLCHAD